MIFGLLSRVERALDAFLAPPPAGPLRRQSARNHVATVSDHPLDDADRAALIQASLGLHDPDVRGWLILTVREFGHGADIDLEWRLPECLRTAIDATLADYVLETT